MRVYVKSSCAFNPIDFSRMGAAWTDDLEGFIAWMRENCPSSTCQLDRTVDSGAHLPWIYCMRFDLPIDVERDRFVEAWGEHREKEEL